MPDTLTADSASERLRTLRERIQLHIALDGTDENSIADVARAVGMQRAWLSRVISEKTTDKLEEVEEVLNGG